ncbi:MAG: ATP-binding protein [Gammaproteobacteria bacterium]|nr:ATP-binding protein [Gammaproteobacteria bacterium]
MHRLYWKIFLAFWLSLVFFVVVTLVAASYYLQQTRARAADENPHERHMTLIREARGIARSEGIAGLERWLAQLDRREATPYYLLDAQNRDLLGRPLPPELAFRVGRQRNHMGQMGQMGDMMMRQAMAVRVADGRSFVLMPDFQGVSLWRVLGRPRVFALPLLVTALLSGLLCYWLARYLLRPVKQLREATQAMAGGDFAQRVAPGLGGRRDEIADLAHDFDHMAARIEQLVSAQMQLLGDISHELRSPLARLVVALELAQQKQGGAASSEFERIALEAERMNDLIGQLLTLSRLESGAGKIAAETVDIDALLERLVENCNFELAADERRAVIVEAAPAAIEGDPALLTSAFENVIRNAARYTAPGTAVEVAARTADGWLEVRVRDHGPGITESMLERVFDPFVRVGDARDRGSGGHGLGLAIAKRAIGLHGGEIAAANHPDGGLEIKIRLRLVNGR